MTVGHFLPASCARPVIFSSSPTSCFLTSRKLLSCSACKTLGKYSKTSKRYHCTSERRKALNTTIPTLPRKQTRKRASTAAVRENRSRRKSGKDKQVAVEVSAGKQKSNYVQKVSRQSVRRYCCRCEKATGRCRTDVIVGAYGIESADICSECRYRCCQNCVHENAARYSKFEDDRDANTERDSSPNPPGWLRAHDAF